MSHIVTIETQLRDPAAIASACRRLGLVEPVFGEAELYSGAAAGLLVRLPGWLYPVVIDAAAGRVRYDNFEGAWGAPEHLDRLTQAYAVEKARIEARKRGCIVIEQALADGSIKLTISVGGAS
ncbi:hypothetical protein [Paludisphaera soli]|uniref:hypothetical protein n=1 Tax=Paludisphaera soli TaxID=2712865 RepID=UPI0013ED9695|nr:hypothetical protein [Paludisphaera soli]